MMDLPGYYSIISSGRSEITYWALFACLYSTMGQPGLWILIQMYFHHNNYMEPTQPFLVQSLSKSAVGTTEYKHNRDTEQMNTNLVL